MKIIDILNAKANGTLEDGFKFKYEGKIYTFINDYCGICTKINNRNISIEDSYRLNIIINDEVEVISDEIDIDSIVEFKFKDDGLRYIEYANNGNTESGFSKNYNNCDIETRIKINELIQAVKQLNNKMEEKYEK